MTIASGVRSAAGVLDLLGSWRWVGCAVLLCSAAAVPAPAQVQLWLSQFGTAGDDRVMALAPDSAGGVFAAGWSNGGLGGPPLGSWDSWLTRHAPDGAKMWDRQIGSAADDRVQALAPDDQGGVYIAGWSTGGVGGAHLGSWDGWLLRFDADGAQAWGRQLGTAQYDEANALAHDGEGGAFVAGVTQGSFGGPLVGLNDVWLARYNSTGTRLWIRQFGSPQMDYVTAMAPGPAGGVYVAGYTAGVLDGLNWGQEDAWLALYGANGARLWIRQFGTVAQDFVHALAADGAGRVYIGGRTTGDLGGINAGSFDGWVARYDSSGAQNWVRQIGTNFSDGVFGLAGDGAGGVYVVGNTSGSLGGPGAGLGDAWLARYDAAGTQMLLVQLGTSAADDGRGAATDGAGGVYIAGFTAGDLGGVNAGSNDAWLARYGTPPPPQCPADFNGDGQVNSTDISAFITSWLDSVMNVTLVADFDGDGVVNSTDISAFITAWLAAVVGGC